MSLPDDKLLNVTELKAAIVAGDLSQKSGSTLPADSDKCPDFDEMDEWVNLDTTEYTNDGYSLDRCPTLGKPEFDDYIKLLMKKFGSSGSNTSGRFSENTVRISGDGTRCLVGNCSADYYATNTGTAEVFVKNGSGDWIQEAQFAAEPYNTSYTAIGFYQNSMAINSDGTRIAIGQSSVAQNRVIIYGRSGTTWTKEKVILSETSNAVDGFGYALSLSADGTKLVVGAPKMTVGSNTNAGKVYVYWFSGTGTNTHIQWQKTFTDHWQHQDASFGRNVIINSDGKKVLAVRDYGVQNIQLFVLNQSTGNYDYKSSQSSGSNQNDEFGFSMDVNSTFTTLIVGAGKYASNGTNYDGRVHIFEIDNSTNYMTSKGTVTASDVTSIQRFGNSVSVNDAGTQFIVGSLYEEGIYSFKLSGTTWSEDRKILDEASGTNFGETEISLAGDGSVALVGARTSPHGSYTGEVFEVKF